MLKMRYLKNILKSPWALCALVPRPLFTTQQVLLVGGAKFGLTPAVS